MFSDGVNGDAVLERRDNGSALLKNLAVFKVGTFTDASGKKATWTGDHLTAMVANFNALKTSAFKNVPWRTNHPTGRRDVNEVVGYYADARTDGTTLYADVELTEPDAVDKWERGTYRERSIELGAYKDPTTDKVFWPVLTGTAFVDRGAVSFAAEDSDQTAIYYMESQDMAEEKKVDADASAKADADAAANADTDVKTDAKDDKSGTDDDSKAKDESKDLAGAHGAHGAPETPTFQFQGKDITQAQFEQFMAGAVATETRLAALEATRNAELLAGRHAFIDQLIENDQMFSSQRDDAVALVDGFTGEQYNAWSKLQASAPKIGLFQDHVEVDVEVTSAQQASEFADRKSTLEQTIQFMSAGQMSQEAIEKSDPYKELQALKAEGEK